MTAYEISFFLHLVGLTMAVGTSFVLLTQSRAAARLGPEEGPKFMVQALSGLTAASIGLALLIVTGMAMLMMRMGELMARGGGAFHAKLGLVLLQIGVFGFMQVMTKKAKREGGAERLATVRKVGMVLLANGVLIVWFAVRAFH